MLRFLAKTSVFLIGISILSLFLFVLLAFIPCNASRYSHEANVRLSIERLEPLKDSSKIIIIGGSGCGYGFKSQLLYDKYKMPVINTGVNANMGLRFQLTLVKQYINKGDYIIICPEYQQFSNLLYGKSLLITILASVYRSGFQLLSFKQILYLLPQIPAHVLYVVRMGNWIPSKDEPGSIFALNQYGDITAYSQRIHKTIPEDPAVFGDSQDTYDELYSYKQFCEKKGAYFLLFPPAYHDAAFDLNFDCIQHVKTKLEDYGIPYVADPSRYRFADSLFYDTVYHMTEKGCEIRTERVIEDIDCFLLH